ncbi:MAG TPA: hypothetical protein VF733_01885 [Candidatus Saccharimonadales bacterium]
MSDLPTPLTEVQHILWENAVRNPVDADAVLDLIDQATETTDDSEQFSTGIIRSLDSAAPGGLGVANVRRLEHMGVIVGDEDVQSSTRCGALALLGLLAMTYDAQLHENLDATDQVGLRLYRAQLSAHIARIILEDATVCRGLTQNYKTTAGVFLEHQTISADEVALELMVMGFGMKSGAVTSKAEGSIADNPQDKVENEESVTLGGGIGDPVPIDVEDLPNQAQLHIEDMFWLKPDAQIFDMRSIYYDGKEVARILDLTDGNHALKDLKEKLLNHHKGDQFWDTLAASIIRHLLTGRANKNPVLKQPTFYTGNRSTNENVVRAYYRPLGNSEDGVPVLGLLAGLRSKQGQSRVIRLLQGDRRASHNISEA